MKHKVKRAVFGIEHARSNEASSGEKDDRQQTPSQRELPWPLRMVGWRLHYFFQRYSECHTMAQDELLCPPKMCHRWDEGHTLDDGQLKSLHRGLLKQSNEGTFSLRRLLQWPTIPDLYRSVIAAADDPLSVGAETHAEDTISGVSLECERLLAGFGRSV